MAPTEIIAFPQHRNVGKARHVAEKWSRRRAGRERDSYCNLVNDNFVRVMRKIGFPDSIIGSELTQFWRLVDREIIALEDEAQRLALVEADAFVQGASPVVTRPSRDGNSGDHPGAA